MTHDNQFSYACTASVLRYIASHTLDKYTSGGKAVTMTKQIFSWNICKMKQFWKEYDNYSYGCRIQKVVWSNAWVCDRSLAGIAGSNLTVAWLSRVSVVLSGKGLCVGLITHPEELTWLLIQCTIIGACVTYTSIGNAV